MSWTEEQYASHMAKLKAPHYTAEGGWTEEGIAEQKRRAEADAPEALIEAECTKILQEDGWRPLRTDPVSDRTKGKGFGEVGMADHLYIRYQSPPLGPLGAAWCQVAWIEFKRGKGGVVSSKQRAWHIRERARGALTLIAGEDFPASVAGFQDWYAKSGLCRRMAATEGRGC